MLAAKATEKSAENGNSKSLPGHSMNSADRYDCCIRCFRPSTQPKVSFLGLFRFADACDVFLTLIGAFSMACSGASIPIHIYVFALFTGRLVIALRVSNVVSANSSAVTDHCYDAFVGNQLSQFGSKSNIQMIVVNEFLMQSCVIGILAFFIALVGLTCCRLSAERQTTRMRETLLVTLISAGSVKNEAINAQQLNQNIDKIQDTLSEKFPVFTRWIGLFLVSYSIHFSGGWQRTLIALVLNLLIVFFTLGVFTKLLPAQAHTEAEDSRRAGSAALEALNVAQASVSSETNGNTERYLTVLNALKSRGIRRRVLGSIAQGATWLVTFGVFSIDLWYASKLTRDSCLLQGSIISCFYNVYVNSMALGSALPLLEAFCATQISTRSVFDIIDKCPKEGACKEDPPLFPGAENLDKSGETMSVENLAQMSTISATLQEVAEVTVEATATQPISKPSRCQTPPPWVRLGVPCTEWCLIAVGVVVSFFCGLAAPVYAVLMSKIMETQLIPDVLDAERTATVFVWIIAVVGGSIGLLVALQQIMLGISGEMLTARLRIVVFSVLSQQCNETFENSTTTAAVVTVYEDVTGVKGAAGVRISTLVQCFATGVASFTIAFYESWQLALALAAFVPINIGSVFLQIHLAKHLAQGQKAAAKSKEKVFDEILSKKTKLDHEELVKACEEYAANNKKQWISACRRAVLFGLNFTIPLAVAFFLYAVCYGYGGHLVIENLLSFDGMNRIFFSMFLGGILIVRAVILLPDHERATKAGLSVRDFISTPVSNESV